VAVHILLSREEVSSILSLYHIDDLEDFGGIAEGSVNSAYWVQVRGRRLFLRITEKKRIQDMIFEKKLLRHLEGHGLPVPHLIENVAKGSFIPWSKRGRYVSLFEFLGGRELGVFEVRAKHVRAIGVFAGRMHAVSEDFDGTRENEFRLEKLEQKLERLERSVKSRRLAGRFAEDIVTLRREFDRQSKRRFGRLPQGTIHGDLFVDNVKFQGDKLVGVIDFEMGATERLVWELAVVINAWCWVPSAQQMGGPAGSFSLPRVEAFFRGYSAHRALAPAEITAMPQELRLVAMRYALSRLVDFELKRLPPERRVFKDYRHFMERLRVLSEGGAEALVEAAVSGVNQRAEARTVRSTS
jgi:homoserine kinase type II